MNNLNTMKEDNLIPRYQKDGYQALDHGIYKYYDSIIVYNATGIHNISWSNHVPSLNTLLEEGEKINAESLSYEKQNIIHNLEQSEQGRIYTLEQIIPMLYPDILQNNFNSLVKESNLLPEQKEKIEMALSIMKSSHKDQFRDEWLPYYLHPLKVAYDLLKEGASYEAIVCGLLHDVVEDDKNINIKFLEQTFWEPLVKDIIKLSKTTRSGKKLSIEEYLLNISSSNTTISVKGQDRINNISSTYFIDSPKKDKYIKETEKIYLPYFEKHNSVIADKIREILKYIKLWKSANEKMLQQIKQIHDSYILKKELD